MAATQNQTNICIDLPIIVYSNGIWGDRNSSSVLKYGLPVFQLQILLILFITQAFHFLLKHFGLPIFVSQILAGIIIGPASLARNDKFMGALFSIRSEEILGTSTTLGYILFMFLSGVKMDVGMIFKTGEKACIIGFLSVAAPLVLGLGVEAVIEKIWLVNDLPDSLPFVTSVLCMTPFPVIASLLAELKILNSELGRVGLAAAMIGEVCSVGLAGFGIFITTGYKFSPRKAFKLLGCTIGFIVFAVFAIRPAMFWVVKQTPKGRPVKDAYIYVIFIAVLGSGYLSNSFGQSLFLGPFVLGLVTPDGPPLGSALVEKFDCFVSGIFLPLFTSTSAMRAYFGALKSNTKLIVIEAIIFFVTLMFKIGTCLIASLYCKMPSNDSWALALILSSKGIVELGTYNAFRDNQTITTETFTMLTIGVLVTATIAPIAVKRLYDPSRKYAGYQKRNIMSLRLDSELPILVCIHSPENITAAINLLTAYSPTCERPIAVYVLHLIKLIGRASPIFISHKIQIKEASAHSYSTNVILSFNKYWQNNMEAVSVYSFTAISPSKSMHEDIGMLALDKLTSLIVLPFHRHWSIDGSIVSDNNTIRALNCRVLERAPCSVAILVDRSHCRLPTLEHSYRVAMIYLGGNDDREALTFAKRMAQNSDISLTVFCLLSKIDDEGSMSWEQMLDSEALKDVKHDTIASSHVKYMEEVVKDAPETAFMLRAIVDKYDLIIVGRRNGIDCPLTSGLSQWSEFPEMGVIGDLLASSDLKCKASVLVVQQQQQFK